LVAVANVEYLDGEVVMGDYGLELSAVQLAVASEHGITLEPAADPPRLGRRE